MTFEGGAGDYQLCFDGGDNDIILSPALPMALQSAVKRHRRRLEARSIGDRLGAHAAQKAITLFSP